MLGAVMLCHGCRTRRHRAQDCAGGPLRCAYRCTLGHGLRACSDARCCPPSVPEAARVSAAAIQWSERARDGEAELVLELLSA